MRWRSVLALGVFHAAAALGQVEVEVQLEAYPPAYVSEWQSRQDILQVNVINNGSQTLDLRAFLRVVGDERGQVLAVWSKPFSAGPGDLVTLSSEELIDFDTAEYDESLKNQIFSTGRIPEDIYTVQVEVYSYQDGQQGELLAEGEATGTVLTFSQPSLVAPTNEDIIPSRDVAFEWTAATEHPGFDVHYWLRIYEVHPPQTPFEAAEANRPFYERELVSEVSFVYPDDAPEFLVGTQYAWMVQATDDMGNPLGDNEGKSEIWTFWYRLGGSQDLAEQLEQLVLEEGMAHLEDLTGLQFQQVNDHYVLNGTATLVLDGLESAPQISCTVQDLEVDLSDPTNPQILSGLVSAQAQAEDLGLDFEGAPIQVKDVQFSTNLGLTVGLSFVNPATGEPLPLDGRLELTTTGLTGSVEGSGTVDAPLFSLGEDVLQLRVTRISVHFSAPQVTLEAQLVVLGEPVSCGPVSLEWQDGNLQGDVSCSPDLWVPLVSGTDLLRLHLTSLDGTVGFDFSSGEPSFDLTAQGSVIFAFGESDLEASVAVHLTPSGLSVSEFSTNVNLANYPLDLGWIRLTWTSLNLEQLSFSTGNWDFRFSGGLKLELPVFPDLDLPVLEDVSLDAEGFHLPALEVSNLSLPPVNLGGFGLALRSFSMPAVDFAWFSGGGSGDWGIQLACELTLPELPASFPDCLRSPGVTLENVSFSSDGLAADLPEVDLEDCPIPLGGDVQLVVRSIAGHFETGSQSFLTVNGRVVLPEGLRCEGYTGPEASLKLHPNGLVEGTIEGLVPPCPLTFGPFEFSVQTAAVILGVENNAQTALLQVEGHLDLPGVGQGQTVTAAGALRYDLLQNQLVDGSIEVNEPFRLDIPSESPFFSFVINQATLDAQGLHVDGAYSLKVGDQTVPVNFQNFVFDPFQIQVVGGSVSFSQSFSVKIALSDGQLDWSLVPFQAEVAEENALRLDLSGDLSMDTEGFHASGQASALVKFAGRTLEQVGVAFEGFTVGLNPPRVTSGRAVFTYEGSEVGELNPSGFVPNLGYFAEAALPEHLPLPSDDIAYLTLREGDQLLVDVENVSDGVRIHTKPGQTVKLVLTALQLGAAMPPEVDLTFDAVFDPSTLHLVSGNIQAQDVQTDLSSFGLPLELTNLNYQNQKFEIGGNLQLFGQAFDGLSLQLDATGHLTGQVSLPIGETFPIIPDVATLGVDSVAGTLDVDLLGFPGFQLTAYGQMDLTLPQGGSCHAPITVLLNQQGFEVQNFAPSCDSLALDFQWIRLAFDDLNVSKLAWSQDEGWDFAFDLSVSLGFPEWGISLPKIEHVGWGEDGFHFPQVEFPDLENVVPPFNFAGFQLKPLAFRMPELQLPWTGGDSDVSGVDWGLRFDFQLSLPNLPDGFPDCLKNPELTILDASYEDGQLSATVETKLIEPPGCPIPLGAATLVVESLSGGFSAENGQQQGYVEFGAHLTLPEGFGCDQPVSLGETHLRISGDGLVTGTVQNVLPPCPLTFGPFQVTVNQSELTLSAEGGSQSVVLNLQGQIQLPGPDGGTVTAQGSLVYDLMNNQLIDGSMVVNQPFRWDLPQDDPVFSFVVQHAELNQAGLTISGGGNLRLGDGASVGVTFNDLGLSFPDLKPVSGGATFQSTFALKITAEGGQLKWAAVDTAAQLDGDFGVLLKLPQVGFQDGKLVASGEGNVGIRYNGQDMPNVRAVFSNGFALSFSPVGVDSGQVDFYVDESHVAVLDKDGFLPLPGLLELIDIPAKVPLPDTSLAYLAIKDADGQLRVTAEKVDGGLHIAGNDVPLVVPGLAYSGSIPQWNISFDVVINPSDWSLVDGSISVAAPPGQALLDLTSAGLPLKLTAVDYGEKNGAAALLISAQLALPEAFGGADLRVDSLTITSSGLSGTASLVPGAGQDYVLSLAMGDMLTVNFASVQLTLGEFACTLTGDLASPLFQDEHMPFTASLTSGGLDVAVDLQALGTLSMGVAEFEPQPVGDSPALQITAGQDFQVVLSGIFRVPTLNDMALTVEGLTLGQSGLTVEDMHLSSPQQFELFGSTFQISDIAFDYENNVFYLNMSGQMTFMQETIVFQNLKVGSDGSFSLEGAFYQGELVVVDPYLKITRIGLDGDSLKVEGEAQLPEPLLQTPQSFAFSVGPNGFSGQIGLKLVQESHQVGDDDTELEFGSLGTLDLIYLGLNLDVGNLENSSVEGVVDFYLENDPNKRFGIGNVNGSQIDPGVTVKFDGSPPQWGEVHMPSNMSFEMQGFSLQLSSLAVPGGESFGLVFSGSLSLGVEGVEGSLGFEGWGFTQDGLEVGTINSGFFSVSDLLTISVTGISYSDSPSQVQITKAQQTSGNAAPDTTAETIDVNWYFQFGGSIDLVDMGGGQIDRFLVFGTNSGVGLVIENAHVQVPDMLDLHVDLQYVDVPEGFKFLIAGSGTFGSSVQVGAAGKLASLNGQTSFGFFVLVGGAVRVPVGPGVMLTGFGGGFFYNPDPADLAIVRNLCQFPGASQEIHDPGKFAAFLYGTVALVDDYVIKGAALLIFTENYFKLDAQVVVLNMGDYLNGSLGLEVGLTKLYVAGDLDIKLKVSDLLKGEQQISVYYYGEDAWAVTGKLEVNILSFAKANGSLYIGPPGFAIEMEISKSFNIVIVEVSAGMEGMAWYVEGVSWGGYFKAWIEAEVLAGAAGAKGWMEFAVVRKTDFIMYGLAGLEVHVLFISWEGSVWAKISSGGGVDAGFGSDSEMERLIDEAKGAAEDMQQAKEQAEQSMEDAKAASLALTPEQLAAAGTSWITQYTEQQKMAMLDEVEGGDAGGLTASERSTLQGVVTGGLDDFPNRQIVEANLEQQRQVVEEKLNALSEAVDQASSTLAGITVTIPDIDSGSDYSLGGSPVTTVNLDAVDKSQLSAQDVQSLEFDLDAQQAQQQQETAGEAEAEFAQLDQRIHEQIAQVWDQLVSLSNQLSSLGQNIGRKHREVLNRMAVFYATTLQYLHDFHWHYIQNIQDLQQRESEIEQTVQHKANRLNEDELRENLKRRKQKALTLAGASQNQVSDALNVIQNLSGQQLKQANIAAGRELWYEVPVSGNQQLAQAVAEKRDEVAQDYKQKIDALEAAMSQLEQALDQLYQAQTELTEIVYDLYDRLRYRNQRVVETAGVHISGLEVRLPSRNYPNLAGRELAGSEGEDLAGGRCGVGTGQSGGISGAPLGAGQIPSLGSNLHLAQEALNWRVDLLTVILKTEEDAVKMLHVPVMEHLSADVYAIPWGAYVNVTYDASHPDKIAEYSFQIQPQGTGPDPNAWVTVGQEDYFPFLFTKPHWPEQVTIYVRARGSGGYTNARSLPLTLQYGNWEGESSMTMVQEGVEMSGDTTPPTEPVVEIPLYTASGSEFKAHWESEDDESGVVDYKYRVYRYKGTGDEFRSKYGAPMNQGSSAWASMAFSGQLASYGSVFSELTGGLQDGASVTGGGLLSGAVFNTGGLTGQMGQGNLQQTGGNSPGTGLGAQFGGIGAGVGLAQTGLGSLAELGANLPLEEWEPVTDWLPGWGRTDVTIRHLQLEHDHAYRVGVKATNGESLESAEGFSNPIVVDQTEPSAPVLLNIEEKPYYAGPMLAAVTEPHYVPGAKFTWLKASDQESGILTYMIAVTEQPLTSWSPGTFTDVGNVSQCELFGGSMVFVDTMWVNLVSVNGAGLVSQVTTAPFVVHDPTPPSSPEIQVNAWQPSASQIDFEVIKEAEDPETDVKGYQLAIGTSPGATDVLDWSWPKGEYVPSVTVGGQKIGLGGGFFAGPNPTLTGKHIITAADLSLEMGQDYYLLVRAVNGDDQPGPPTGAAHFRVDTTPPPGAAVEVSASSSTLQFSFKGVEDPESGVQRVDVQVQHKDGETVLTWTTVATDPPGNFAWSTSFSQGPGEYMAKVRIVNSAGRQVVQEVPFKKPDFTPPTVQLGAIQSVVRLSELQPQVHAEEQETQVKRILANYSLNSLQPVGPWLTVVDTLAHSVDATVPVDTGVVKHGRTVTLFVLAANVDDIVRMTHGPSFTVIGRPPAPPTTVVLEQTGSSTFRVSWECKDPAKTIKEFEVVILRNGKGSSQLVKRQTVSARTQALTFSAPLPVGSTLVAAVKVRNVLGDESATAQSQPLQVGVFDNVAPRIAWLHGHATYGRGGKVSVQASWAASDAESGLDKAELSLVAKKLRGSTALLGRVDVPASVQTYTWQNLSVPEGTTELRVRLEVRDRAGNVATRTVQVR